jgi:hypothetical protein
METKDSGTITGSTTLQLMVYDPDNNKMSRAEMSADGADLYFDNLKLAGPLFHKGDQDFVIQGDFQDNSNAGYTSVLIQGVGDDAGSVGDQSTNPMFKVQRATGVSTFADCVAVESDGTLTVADTIDLQGNGATIEWSGTSGVLKIPDSQATALQLQDGGSNVLWNVATSVTGDRTTFQTNVTIGVSGTERNLSVEGTADGPGGTSTVDVTSDVTTGASPTSAVEVTLARLDSMSASESLYGLNIGATTHASDAAASEVVNLYCSTGTTGSATTTAIKTAANFDYALDATSGDIRLGDDGNLTFGDGSDSSISWYSAAGLTYWNQTTNAPDSDDAGIIIHVPFSETTLTNSTGLMLETQRSAGLDTANDTITGIYAKALEHSGDVSGSIVVAIRAGVGGTSGSATTIGFLAEDSALDYALYAERGKILLADGSPQSLVFGDDEDVSGYWDNTNSWLAVTSATNSKVSGGFNFVFQGKSPEATMTGDVSTMLVDASRDAGLAAAGKLSAVRGRVQGHASDASSSAVLRSFEAVTSSSGSATKTAFHVEGTDFDHALFVGSGQITFDESGTEQANIQLDTSNNELEINTSNSHDIRLSPDGVVVLDKPLQLKSYTVLGVPAAASSLGQLVFVSNESGGAVPAYSDGTNWRRFSDGAIIG